MFDNTQSKQINHIFSENKDNLVCEFHLGNVNNIDYVKLFENISDSVAVEEISNEDYMSIVVTSDEYKYEFQKIDSKMFKYNNFNEIKKVPNKFETKTLFSTHIHSDNKQIMFRLINVKKISETQITGLPEDCRTMYNLCSTFSFTQANFKVYIDFIKFSRNITRIDNVHEIVRIRIEQFTFPELDAIVNYVLSIIRT